MSRTKGTYTTLENWALDLAPSLPGAAGWVLVALARQVNYKRQTLTVGQMIDSLPFKERTVQIACAYLAAEGYILTQGGAHVLRGARAELAQDLRKNVRIEWDVNTRQEGETTKVYFGITRHNQKESEERERREEKTVTAGLVATSEAAAQPAQPQTETPEQTLPASSGKAVDFTQPKTAELQTPATPVPSRVVVVAENHGDDHDAVEFFLRLAGPNFTRTYRLSLARWMETYSQGFIELAHRLAPTLPGAKGYYVFADLLDQDPRKPWPVELHSKYRADAAASRAEKVGSVPQIGEVRACGTTRGRVIAVDLEEKKLDLQTGQDATEYITVMWASTQPIQRTA